MSIITTRRAHQCVQCCQEIPPGSKAVKHAEPAHNEMDCNSEPFSVPSRITYMHDFDCTAGMLSKTMTRQKKLPLKITSAE